jgi:hypothetical protein
MKNANERTFVRRALLVFKKNRWVKKGARVAVVMGGSHGKGFDLIQVG